MADDRGAGEGRLPISAFVIARDEAARLPRCLASLAFCDEIVLVDSGSTDGTPEIARAAGARVEHRAWEGYGPQKSYAEGLCRHDWVLNLDADEAVTPELEAELRALCRGGAAPAAYRLSILTVYPGAARPRPFANDYRVVRFYHRSVGRYRAHPLFDRVEVTGPERRLCGALWHWPVLDWAQFVAKENRYSSFQAETAAPRGRLGLRVRLVLELPLAFLKFYVVRRHLLGGWRGFAFAAIAAFARWLRVLKLLERAETARRAPGEE